MRVADARVVVVGLGGLGSPAATVLAQSGAGHMTLVDDDAVSESNLHRQTLYDARDLSRPKTEVAAARLTTIAREAGRSLQVATVHGRFTPDTALALAKDHDLVLEGADNLATKFLTADACAITGTPLVQGGAVRWAGWALAGLPGHGACLRCVFESIPEDRVETCAQAGVVGPMVGVLGALMAALALRLMGGRRDALGVLYAYDGLAGSLRATRPEPRPGCPLCGGQIRDVSAERYAPPTCAP